MIKSNTATSEVESYSGLTYFMVQGVHHGQLRAISYDLADVVFGELVANRNRMDMIHHTQIPHDWLRTGEQLTYVTVELELTVIT